MKIKDLIKQLSALDDCLDISVRNQDDEYYMPLMEIDTVCFFEALDGRKGAVIHVYRGIKMIHQQILVQLGPSSSDVIDSVVVNVYTVNNFIHYVPEDDISEHDFIRLWVAIRGFHDNCDIFYKNTLNSQRSITVYQKK